MRKSSTAYLFECYVWFVNTIARGPISRVVIDVEWARSSVNDYKIDVIRQHAEGEQINAQAIRIARTSKEAVANLQKEFKLSKVQASFLVDLPLSRLTSFTKENLDKEKADYKQRLLFLKKLL